MAWRILAHQSFFRQDTHGFDPFLRYCGALPATGNRLAGMVPLISHIQLSG